MNVELSSAVYSPDQIGLLLWELDVVINKLRNDQVRQRVIPSTHPEPITTSLLLQGVLENSNVNKNDLHAVEELATELERIRDALPQVHMVLGNPPSLVIKQQIVSWLRREIHPQVLCNFVVRSDLGGGAILRTKANQYDFSFRTQLIAKKHRIQELISNA